MRKLSIAAGPWLLTLLVFAGWLALLMLAVGGARAQTTTASAVPVERVDAEAGQALLLGVRDTALVTWDSTAGVPVKAVLANQDSVFAYYNNGNMEWRVSLVGVLKSGGWNARFKLNREIYYNGSWASSTSDTCWVKGWTVYNPAPWGNGIDLILSQAAAVGDRFVIYFRRTVPLKMDSNGFVKFNLAKPDSVNTY